MELVELKVHMDCPGCERTIRKTLSKIKGIHSLDIDMNHQKVTIMGYVDRYRVLQKVRNTGKRAEFWPYPEYDYQNHIHPYNRVGGFPPTYGSDYNYRRHGYSDTYGYTYGRIQSRPGDEVVNFFSDENPHSCSVM